MRATRLSIQALAVLVLAVPTLAEEVAPATSDAVVQGVAPASDAVVQEDAFATSDEAMEDAAASAEDATAPAALADDMDSAMPVSDMEDGSAMEAAQAADAEATEDLDAAAVSEPVDATAPGFDTHPPLGATGYDSEGRRGRIHIVVRGDTLWDISDAYLGTAWVWPSIWQDNGEIENPHLIYPGDRIWITPSEMRKISAEEAAAMLANQPVQPGPAATEELALEPDPEPVPAPTLSEPVERGSVVVSSREMAGLITPEALDAASSIVGRVPERVLVSQEDDVFIGLGESEIEVGDQLTAFRTHEKVFDPDSGVLLGYHVEFLGWLEVKQTFPETALAKIRMATGEIEEGVRLIPREPLPTEIPLQASPEGVEGKISFFPQQRVVIGYNDFVFLNRGTVDGLEVGSPLEVYRPGYAAKEEVRRDQVLVPDYVIGQMVVVRAEAESSVALVMNSKTELALGDRFRGADRH